MKEKRVQFEYKNKLLFKSKFRKIKPITMISSRDIRKNMIPPSETRTIVRERQSYQHIDYLPYKCETQKVHILKKI
jgi:hypothetical protein